VGKRSGKPGREKWIEKEAIVKTVPIVAETEIIVDPSVGTSSKAESSSPGEETDGRLRSKPIPRLTV
jgi:hypothetical protein